MTELSVRFTSEEMTNDSPIAVSLFRLDTGTSVMPAKFELPMDDKELAEIRWYLEDYNQWPTESDAPRVQRIHVNLELWGRKLLSGITDSRDAARLWQQFADSDSESKLITIDATDPRVLRLPWELLADEGGHIFSQGIALRRRLQQATTAPVRTFSLPVRILMVVSRPDDVSFIDPRSDARSVLDALEHLGNAVSIEFAYPPTLEELTRRLRDKTAPPIHVVHFDGHGVYDKSLGLGYLIFEAKDHKKDRIDANQLGTLLNRCGVPLMVLSACQSSQQEQVNPFDSVAARLIRAGVGSVLAMNYSVLVSATEKFMPAFYSSLTEGLSVGKSVDEGRIRLLSDEIRGVFVKPDANGNLREQTLRLRDWFLPSLYQQAADPIVFDPKLARDFPVQEHIKPRSLTDSSCPGGLPPEPQYEFVGRARELLQIERALHTHGIVVLHGFGGIGKTTLAAEAGCWFFRTNRFPGGAAFISFEHGGSLHQLCSWIGQAVGGDENFILRQGDPVENIGNLLKERPALVLLDNFESVLGKDAIMPQEELSDILNAVFQWSKAVAAGKNAKPSRFLITSRDTSFDDVRFSPSKDCAFIELSGLGKNDALKLAAAILDVRGIDRSAIDRRELIELMDRLGGHPLSLCLVLPHLKDYSPKELTENFEELLPGFKTGAAEQRNESLTVSLEFSIRRLGEDTQKALPDLAVFQGGALEGSILEITEIDPDVWKTMRAELQSASLITAESVPGVGSTFLSFHPTLAPYLAKRLNKERKAYLEDRYWADYSIFADILVHTDIQMPHKARAIAAWEMSNFNHALDIAIFKGEIDAAVSFAGDIEKFLALFGRWREQDILIRKIEAIVPKDSDKLTQSEFLMKNRKGGILLQQGRSVEAEKIFQELLQKMESGADYDVEYDRGLTLNKLALCMRSQGKLSEAIEYHHKAIVIFEDLKKFYEKAKLMLCSVYAELGGSLMLRGQLDDAQKVYEHCLDMSKVVDNPRVVALVFAHLGILAQMRHDLKQAWALLSEALETFQKLGDLKFEGIYWNHLGIVAQEAQNWDEAERCYRESLKISESMNDLLGIATVCNQLGAVAELSGRSEDAERWLLKALEGFEKTQESHYAAVVSDNISGIYLSQNRLDESEQYAKIALQIDESIGDSSVKIWENYERMAHIAKKCGRKDEAKQWRLKAYKSKDAFPGTWYKIAPILEHFKPVIEAIVAACNGNEEAKAAVEAKFDIVKENGWQIVEPIQSIWNGERDANSLTADINYESRAVILAILSLLSGQNPFKESQSQETSHTESESDSSDEEQGISIENLIQMAVLATQPGIPKQISKQIRQVSQQLREHDSPEYSALGRVLNDILTGKSPLDLSGLPEEMAEVVVSCLNRDSKN